MCGGIDPDGLPDFNANATGATGGNNGTRDTGTDQDGGEGAGKEEQEGGWPEPQDLIAHSEAKPYPVEALPPTIKAAVEEVNAFVQCPVAMTAGSALAVLSTVGQGLVDVSREPHLNGPTSLFQMVNAVSGERKSANDGHFSQPLIEYDLEKAKEAEVPRRQHEAKKRSWDAKEAAILKRIKDEAAKCKSTANLDLELEQLYEEKPEPPKVPRVVVEDATTEALQTRLAYEWPVAAVISNEAGVIFGGHSMRSETRVSGMAFFNGAWDGKGVPATDRQTRDSSPHLPARLSMSLAIQPEILKQFLESSKGAARGIGFLARFLFANPQSKMGERLFKKSPEHWPHLEGFHRRIRELLNMPLPMNERDEIKPDLLKFTPEAERVWTAYHNEIEVELKLGRDFFDVPDVACKSADNAARMAALFHLFENGEKGTIGKEHMEGAVKIAHWHLYEALRFVWNIEIPERINNALKLGGWLRGRCNRDRVDSLLRNYVRKHGPNLIRDPKLFPAALEELTEAGWIRVVMKDGSAAEWVEVNPELLG